MLIIIKYLIEMEKDDELIDTGNDKQGLDKDQKPPTTGVDFQGIIDEIENWESEDSQMDDQTKLKPPQ